MDKAVISIVYHNDLHYTKSIAVTISKYLRNNFCSTNLLPVKEAMEQPIILHQSDTILFGCETVLGNVAAPFKQFMDWTQSFWYRQLWKDKLAAGFTVCTTTNGDKLNTLVSLSLFAAQHSMIWISQGIMPRFLNNEQTDGQNRMASYMGMMAQSNLVKRAGKLHPGDALTAELFAKRILDITKQFKLGKIITEQ